MAAVTDLGARRAAFARRARPRLTAKVAVPLAIILLLIGYPTWLLVTTALNVGDPLEMPAHELGFSELMGVFDRFDWIGNTLLISTAGTIVATIIGVVLAWILHRTTVPGTRLFELLIALPFPLGPLVGALAWNILGAPYAGLINRGWMALTGSTDPLFSTWSVPGITFVMAIFEAPIAVLIIGAAMQRMDSALEESSAVFGGNKLRTALRITLPLMLPAIGSAALFVFVTMLGAFAIPAVLGAGSRFQVAMTGIYTLFQGYPPNYPQAAQLGIVLVAITMLAVWLNARLARGRTHAVVGGRSYRPRRLDMGRWTWPLFAVASFYVLLTLVLPLGSLLLASFQRSADIQLGAEAWTLRNYRYVLFEYDTTRRAILNSLYLGIATGTLGVAASTVVAWIVQRSRGAGRGLLEQAAMLPQAFPRLIFSIGLLWMVFTLPIPIYGTIWAVLLAYLIVFLPLGYRTMAGVIGQIDPELEEAARTHGAAWGRVMRTVTAPLLRSGMAAAWALLFMVSVREVAASIFLMGVDTPVLGPAILSFWQSGGLPRVSALAVVQVVIVLMLFVVVRRLTPKPREAR